MREQAERAEWLIFVAGHADRPVRVFLDYDILEGLWMCDENAWAALLEFLDGHIRSRNDEVS